MNIHSVHSIPSSSYFFLVKPCNRSYYTNAPQLSFSIKRPCFSPPRQLLIASISNTNNSTSLSRSPDNHNVNIAIDFNQLQSLVVSRINSFLYAGKEALHDLKTLINIDHNGSLFFLCRKSTLRFLGNVLLWGFVLVIAFRILFGILSRLKNRDRGDHANKPRYVVRRDRSLGGREVVVAVDDEDEHYVTMKKDRKRVLDNLNKDFELLTEKERKDDVSVLGKSPKWWPISMESNQVSLDDREVYQREANRLIRGKFLAISELNRTSRQYIMDDDILELRRTCRTSGVQASIDSEKSREAIYRIAVDYVLSFCSRYPSDSSSVDIGDEDCCQFIAGFAQNIGLETFRAASIVSGAVAAQTRSRFLQAWASELQGKHYEAIWELQRICLVFRFFPPEESSAEMEMVARGLAKELTVEQRELLLKMVDEAGFGEAQTSAAEALGLVRVPKLV
ncbi:hypothetical protein ACFE04_008685 [Oxalis oulophora]